MDQEIEKAIRFLSAAIDKSGHNPKPVVKHGVVVELHLLELGHDKEVVIGGILHDILADTQTTYEQIKNSFGEEVANLVQANTLNRNIEDEKEKYKELFDRCLRGGKKALLIKAADLWDNSNYYHNSPDKIRKVKYFIDLSAE